MHVRLRIIMHVPRNVTWNFPFDNSLHLILQVCICVLFQEKCMTPLSAYYPVCIHFRILSAITQGCQLWMRVRREIICEARPLAAYKCRASPKNADEQGGGGGGGGGGVGELRHFFFLPQKFWQPFSHSRHIVGVPFVHHKPLTSNNKKNKKNNNKQTKKQRNKHFFFFFFFFFFFGREIFPYICVREWDSGEMGWNAWVSRSMRESWQPCITSWFLHVYLKIQYKEIQIFIKSFSNMLCWKLYEVNKFCIM